MITCHFPCNARRSITPISLKQYEGIENSANYHAEEPGISRMNIVINMQKITNETLDKERSRHRVFE